MSSPNSYTQSLTSSVLKTPIHTTLGINLTSQSLSPTPTAKIQFTTTAIHLTPSNTVHGGISSLLIDTACFLNRTVITLSEARTVLKEFGIRLHLSKLGEHDCFRISCIIGKPRSGFLIKRIVDWFASIVIFSLTITNCEEFKVARRRNANERGEYDFLFWLRGRIDRDRISVQVTRSTLRIWFEVDHAFNPRCNNMPGAFMARKCRSEHLRAKHRDSVAGTIKQCRGFGMNGPDMIDICAYGAATWRGVFLCSSRACSRSTDDDLASPYLSIRSPFFTQLIEDFTNH